MIFLGLKTVQQVLPAELVLRHVQTAPAMTFDPSPAVGHPGGLSHDTCCPCRTHLCSVRANVPSMGGPCRNSTSSPQEGPHIFGKPRVLRMLCVCVWWDGQTHSVVLFDGSKYTDSCWYNSGSVGGAAACTAVWGQLLWNLSSRMTGMVPRWQQHTHLSDTHAEQVFLGSAAFSAR